MFWSEEDMDIEAPKDDLSFEDGKLVVFTDIDCRVPQASTGKLFSKMFWNEGLLGNLTINK